VLGKERLAVHLVGQHHALGPGLGDGERALVRVLLVALDPPIEAGEDEVDRIGPDAGLVEQRGQGGSGPAARAHRLE